MKKPTKQPRIRRNKRARMPTSEPPEQPPTDSTPKSHLVTAVAEAREILEGISEAGKRDLLEATILQGVASGDVMAAAVATRLRLQNENLRLKVRLNRWKEKRERIRAEILERSNKDQPTRETLVQAIREVYGL